MIKKRWYPFTTSFNLLQVLCKFLFRILEGYISRVAHLSAYPNTPAAQIHTFSGAKLRINTKFLSVRTKLCSNTSGSSAQIALLRLKSLISQLRNRQEVVIVSKAMLCLTLPKEFTVNGSAGIEIALIGSQYPGGFSMDQVAHSLASYSFLRPRELPSLRTTWFISCSYSASIPPTICCYLPQWSGKPPGNTDHFHQLYRSSRW